jgi:hypothetical protein
MGSKIAKAVGVVLSVVLVVGLIGAALGDLRQQWHSARSFGFFLLSLVGVESGPVQRNPSVLFQEELRKRGQAFRGTQEQWFGARAIRCTSNEEVLRKALRLKLATVALSREVEAIQQLLKKGRLEKLVPPREAKEFFAPMEAAMGQWATVVELQNTQLSILEQWSSGWSDSSKSLTPLGDPLDAIEKEIQQSLKDLVNSTDQIKRLAEGASPSGRR